METVITLSQPVEPGVASGSITESHCVQTRTVQSQVVDMESSPAYMMLRFSHLSSTLPCLRNCGVRDREAAFYRNVVMSALLNLLMFELAWHCWIVVAHPGTTTGLGEAHQDPCQGWPDISISSHIYLIFPLHLYKVARITCAD